MNVADQLQALPQRVQEPKIYIDVVDAGAGIFDRFKEQPEAIERNLLEDNKEWVFFTVEKVANAVAFVRLKRRME